MIVTEINNKEQFDQKVLKADKSVVMFTANWNINCRIMKPFFLKLSASEPIRFYLLDIDRVRNILSATEISTIPLFQFFHQGQKISQLSGADQNELLKLIAKFKDL